MSRRRILAAVDEHTRLADAICDAIDPHLTGDSAPSVSLHCDCGRWRAVAVVGHGEGAQ